VLLRCLDTDCFMLPDGHTCDAATVAAVLDGMRPAGTGRHAVAIAPDLLLPAARCLLTTVPVARHEARLLHRTLPWRLEDRLLEPAGELHFATSAVRQGHADVCAVNKAWLAEVLAALAAAGLQPRRAVSELLQLPWHSSQWTVLMPATDSAPCLVRHGRHAGFACAATNLQLALQLLLNESPEPPHALVVYAAPDLDFVATDLLPPLLLTRLQLQRQEARDLLQTALPEPTCNLLQGAFAPRLPLARWWQQWRIAALLLVALLLTDVTLTGLQTRALAQQTAAAEAELLALFRSVQPEGAVVNPRLQLQQAIAGLGGRVQPGFLTLLGRMAPALAAQPGAAIRSLDYSAATGELGLLVETPGFAAAESLRMNLQQAGLQAELLGSSSDGSRSLTRLRVGS
jgi:general secretion pathway protein L